MVARKAPQIWGCKVPFKVRFFMWLAFNDRLLTCAYCSIWRPGDPTSSALCGDNLETTQHLFCGCAFAKEVWLNLGSSLGGGWCPSDLDHLWELGRRLSRRNDRSLRSKILQSLVPAVMWVIWIGRNDKIFRGTLVSTEGVWEDAKRNISAWGCLCGGASRVLVERNSILITS
ncbi:hypothetical protein QJS10_CPB21g00763 [Acorus calamus]|uniref:Reverse transcriptase zinc-binding domain-containing protein n=1 Tax=Acorus calamus TaxID=4465 RepID=A0AAV9C4L7_ACOCL|nr:hypothetical protein QJS10_CPB21g00763 [Acorus calamus]